MNLEKQEKAAKKNPRNDKIMLRIQLSVKCISVSKIYDLKQIIFIPEHYQRKERTGHIF